MIYLKVWAGNYGNTPFQVQEFQSYVNPGQPWEQKFSDIIFIATA